MTDDVYVICPWCCTAYQSEKEHECNEKPEDKEKNRTVTLN